MDFINFKTWKTPIIIIILLNHYFRCKRVQFEKIMLCLNNRCEGVHQIHRWLFYCGTPDKYLNGEKMLFLTNIIRLNLVSDIDWMS